jgi:hypothetical protein
MKRLILMAVVVLTALTAMAQGGIGKAPGWTVQSYDDDFTDEKTYNLEYYDQQKVLTAVYFPNEGRMTLVDWYDGKLYFDVTFDAVMDYRGHIGEKYISYDIHVGLPKGESREDSGNTKMKYSDVQKAGQLFYGMFNIFPTIDDLKRGTTINVRWNAPIRGRETVKKISLAGFTKKFEECAKKSVENLMRKNGIEPKK